MDEPELCTPCRLAPPGAASQNFRHKLEDPLSLPDLSNLDFALAYQTCIHEAAHALLTLRCTELTLKDEAITDGGSPEFVALTATTAVRPGVATTQKHREIACVALAGKAGEERLAFLTRNSEHTLPANPVHWKRDLDLHLTHVKAGGLGPELERLHDEVDETVEQHWEFVVELAGVAIRSLPRPVMRDDVLRLAVKHGVLTVPVHP